MESFGFDEKTAKAIEAGHKRVFKGIHEFNQKNIEFAVKNGYMDTVMGLRIATPVLHRHTQAKYLTKEGGNESRTACNAVSQVAGTLNSLASIDFTERLESSDFAKDIYITANIHDAIYGIAKFKPEVIYWLNINLPGSMVTTSNYVPHKTIKMAAELELFLPTWDKSVELSNDMSLDEIKTQFPSWLKQLNP